MESGFGDEKIILVRDFFSLVPSFYTVLKIIYRIPDVNAAGFHPAQMLMHHVERVSLVGGATIRNLPG